MTGHVRCALAVVLATALVIAAGVFVVEVLALAPEGLWKFCREANSYVAVLAAGLVCFRLAFLVMDRARWTDKRVRHMLLWFIYIAVGLFVVSRGSAYLTAAQAPASVWSGVRLLLTFMAIVLSIWWPHPRAFTPVEETHRAQSS